ncbi:MAG: hypothetical protein MZV64_52940 [Ignavibacteriales bacterium]|nr:hypothetical protein [Ignavibacteriales bacterium]
MGLSDYTQQRNGDVAFAEPKEVGTRVRTGKRSPSSRPSRSTSASRRPWQARSWKSTASLLNSPELVNQDPYGKGWLAVLEVEDGEAARRGLKTAAEYLAAGQGPGGSRGPAMTRKIPIVPCSGIGKSLGAAAREAAYVLTEDLRPDRTKVVALAPPRFGRRGGETRGRRRGGRRHRRLQARMCRQEPGLVRRVQGPQDGHFRCRPPPSRPQARRRLRPQRGWSAAGPGDGRRGRQDRRRYRRGGRPCLICRKKRSD